MRITVPQNQIELAIEDDENSETAYVQITTDATVTVQGAAGDKETIELEDDLTL